MEPAASSSGGQESEERTAGQKQALAALRAIGAASGGDLVLDDGYRQMTGRWLDVRIWLCCDEIPRSDGGVELEEWEPVVVGIPENYPLKHPVAMSGHLGFAGQPHVLWGSTLCLYAASGEWDPAAGMGGFLRRLVGFYERLALGQFEDPQVPWHPPVAYAVPQAGCVIMAADLAARDQMQPEPVLRWAVGVRQGRERIDVVEWLGPLTLAEPAGDLVGTLTGQLGEARARIGDLDVFLVLGIVLPAPIGFEYPVFVDDLLIALERVGIEQPDLLYRLYCTMAANRRVRGLSEPDGEDTYLIVRARAGQRQAAALAHFAAWRLMAVDAAAVSLEGTEAEALQRIKEWLEQAMISWAMVYDTRPAAVLRRDAGRAVERVAGLRILVLGCGALGAPIAEYCVRAGAAQVHVVDSGDVHPGILVRQPYEDDDIGLPKADQLASRLSRIRLSTLVVGHVADAMLLPLMRRPCPRYFDLVIDATANRSVATAIECSKRLSPEHWPDLITVAIGRSARYGVATTALRGTRGGGVDLLRSLGLAACDRADLEDVFEEFFPRPGTEDLFVPEPGCSEPTFVGAATDVAALAAQLLDGALGGTRATVRVSMAGEAGHFPPERTLVISRLAHDDENQRARTRLVVPHDRIVADRNGIYEIRIDRRAMQQMRRFVAEMAAAVAADSETGGLLLGQFDDACQVAWVTTATGPPDGSLTSPVLLQLNAPAAREFVQQRSDKTRGLTAFAGFWHTHPGTEAAPSGQDRQTMSQLLAEAPGYAPRLLMLIVGVPGRELEPPDRQPVRWDPDLYAEVLVG